VKPLIRGTFWLGVSSCVGALDSRMDPVALEAARDVVGVRVAANIIEVPADQVFAVGQPAEPTSLLRVGGEGRCLTFGGLQHLGVVAVVTQCCQHVPSRNRYLLTESGRKSRFSLMVPMGEVHPRAVTLLRCQPCR
jgi:hypothetical protein